MRATILGCGPSGGVPRLGLAGGDWGACDPANPLNRRRRSSLLLQADGFTLLVDSGPDCRAQLMDAGVTRIDAVIWTHDHADHTHGLDDLRPFAQRQGGAIPAYGRADMFAGLATRFAYAFRGNPFYPALFAPRPLQDEQTIGPFRVHVADQPHGAITSAGLCFESERRRLGYATDFVGMTDDMHRLYSRLDVWVVAALGRRAHPIHASLPMALDWIDQLKPRQAVITHMGSSLDHGALTRELPAHVRPAHDGMIIDL